MGTGLRRALLLAATISPFQLSLSAQAASVLSPATIAARATPATVTIVTFSARGDTLGQGSGFIVRPSGVIVTNWHVIAGAGAATIILANGERYSRVLYLDGDSTRDVALLQIPGADLPVLTVRNDAPPPGSRVVVIGSPVGLARTVTDGVVSAKRIVQGVEMVQISAPISHGSSGGPVLDTRGRVFAIASAFLTEGQQLNFAVPVRYAMGLLALNPTPQPLATLSWRKSGSDVTDSSAVADLAAALWTPQRRISPRASLSGTYRLHRWAQITNKGVQQPAFTASDFLAIHSDGYGLLGYACDSLELCNLVGFVALRTSGSGDVVFDLSYGALDGYQTDSGFVVHGEVPASTGGTAAVWIRGWLSNPPLSHRSGSYSCTTRTQFVSGRFRGDYLDWTGEATVAETKDTTYLSVQLANSSGGSTYGFFRMVRDRDQTGPFAGTAAYPERKQSVNVSGHWTFGHFYADWEDIRENNERFVGPLNCDRR